MFPHEPLLRSFRSGGSFCVQVIEPLVAKYIFSGAFYGVYFCLTFVVVKHYTTVHTTQQSTHYTTVHTTQRFTLHNSPHYTMTHRETKLCVDGIILSNDGGKSVYLMKRAGDVEHGKWAFPGGRVDTTDDSDVDALVREVSEEIGVRTIAADWTRFVGVANNSRDPRGFTATIAFFIFINPAEVEFSLNKSEAMDGKWFGTSELLTACDNMTTCDSTQSATMAFDHRDILSDLVLMLGLV